MSSPFRRGLELILVIALLAACGGSETGGAEETEVSGSVTLPARTALPADAVVEVKLVDVSRADAPAEILDRETLTASDGPPFEFRLEVLPGRVDDRMSYAVQARVLQDDELLFINDTHIPVLTRGAPSSHVEVPVVQVP